MKFGHLTNGSRLMHILRELLSFFWRGRTFKDIPGIPNRFFFRNTSQNDLSRVPHCRFKGWNLHVANPLQQGLLALIR